jgi:hypothetical protein
MSKEEFFYTATITVFMDDCTGMEENPGSSYKVFPNPATSHVLIDGLDAAVSYQIQLVNLNGQVISSRRAENQSTFELDMSSYPAGIYFVTIQNGQAEFSTRILKQ